MKNDRAGVKETERYFMASRDYIRQTGKARQSTFRSTMTMEYNSSVGKWIIIHRDNRRR